MDAADRAPVPWALIAWTRKLYAVPFVSPVITAVVAIPEMNSVRTTVAPVRTWTW